MKNQVGDEFSMDLTIELTMQNMAQIASAIRRSLNPGVILSISGKMGAGKTTLIKNILAEYEVASPSFLHVLEYGSDFAHIDAYTIKSPEALMALDLANMLQTRALIVEWGELFAKELDALDAQLLKIQIMHDLISDRRFILVDNGDILKSCSIC